MGKHAAAGLFKVARAPRQGRALLLACALAVALIYSPAVAEEDVPRESGFKPGAFFTQDDFEHLQAALAYLDLTPEDLSYEKKHAPHAMLLEVVRQSLDQPLTVPAIAEEAAREFSARGPAGSGAARSARHAARLLDLPAERWEGEEPPRLEGRALMEALFGGIPESLIEAGKSEESLLVGFETTVAELRRTRDELSDEEARKLAHVAASSLVPGGAPLPGSAEGTADMLALAPKVDLASRFVAASSLVAALEALAGGLTSRAGADPEWARGQPSEIAGVTGSVVAAWEGPWGKFVIGGTGPNTYEGDDFIGIIDLGGDDIYRGRVASAIGLPGHSPLSFVLDLGGNDRFEGGNFTQGFGFLGVGVLMALGEGDNYYSADFCAQGAGLCGVGWLIDDGGNDTFVADSFAQGAGMFGFGHLVNAGGNDVYRAARYAQAFAGVRGVGVLSDGGGNDLYYAGGKYLHQPLFNDRYQSLSQGFAIGNRGAGVAGGVALLLAEGDGNDVFHADIYGQGSSYWYSLGMLVSQGGNDTFTLGQYGQGGGIHLSTGILVNLAGHDTYTNVHGVGTGGAHDWGVGWLIDRAGNDLYQGNGQGQGLNYSIGILLDCGGNDSHSSSHEGNIGKGVNNDISLLLNLAGDNSYTPKDVQPGQLTRRGRHAMVYDPPEGWWPGLDTSTLPTPQDPPPDRTRVQHILISWEEILRVEKKAKRTKEEAKELMLKVLRQARSKGADWKQLQLDYNEDNSDVNATYEVERERRIYVQPFQDLALRLGPGQIDWCESQFGYHIIKRVE